ncbi:hypothetical protein A9Q99_21885 [Gammaproteobacteria bacterium 45_16_T64]|nr:hypothetical protein A9Q99_21885 [Gammaproteobacteria bacterium 45_16_T64]
MDISHWIQQLYSSIGRSTFEDIERQILQYPCTEGFQRPQALEQSIKKARELHQQKLQKQHSLRALTQTLEHLEFAFFRFTETGVPVQSNQSARLLSPQEQSAKATFSSESISSFQMKDWYRQIHPMLEKGPVSNIYGRVSFEDKNTGLIPAVLLPIIDDSTQATSCILLAGINNMDPFWIPLVLDDYKLTPKENQLATLLIQGFTKKDLAAVLGVSPETVKSHTANILKKTGHQNQLSLINQTLGRIPHCITSKTYE